MYRFFIFLLVMGMVMFSPFVCAEESSELKSTLKAQYGVEVTIYNSGLALIKDLRKIEVPQGTCRLQFMDVASKIDPATVHIKSLTNPEGLRILEQNYEYDLISPDKLIEKYVGKNVKLWYKNPYTDKEEVKEALLISNNGGLVFKIDEDVYLWHPGKIILPKIPEDLIAKPTLVWLLENKHKGEQKVGVSYLTDGITWRADYVLVVDKEDTGGDITGWVTIDNRSGITYKNATLKLVAGKVYRAGGELPREGMFRGKKSLPAVPSFEEKAFFEYHIYDLQRKTTIKDNQQKQINFMDIKGIKLEKELVYKAPRIWFMHREVEPIGKEHPQVIMKIKNTAQNKLGIPLPEGIVRVYREDSDGSLQFIGEDRVEHTPKGEEVKLRLGEAFDVVIDRKQTDWEKIAKDVYESSWEIEIRNHKGEETKVILIEQFPGTWKILENNMEYEKIDAHRVKFTLSMPKDGKVVVKYRIRIKT